jgi:murein DD-endopeptidase MepM/ murein hydrolase activator NlpD
MPKGSKVKSTAPGRVSYAGRSGDFGRLVVIDHGGGWETRYAHLKSIEVKRGKKIERGTVVGTVGKSGNASGYHLHYEIRRDGRAVDPGGYLAD